MNYLIDRMLRLRPEDIRSMVMLSCTFLPAKIYKHWHKDIWVVTEYPENARDNGYWLFKYIRENDPDKQVYYPIRKGSSDYGKVSVLGNTVEFGGWKHYFLFWAANKFIGTTKYHGFPDERICGGIFELKLHRFQYVFLNHGFARGFSNIVNRKNTNYDMIIAMSELEKQIMVDLNGQPPELIKPIGFCRHDNLDDRMLDPGLIVVMPTWRRWLDYRHEKNPEKIAQIQKAYLESAYYREYNRMIRDPELLAFLEKHDLHMIFYLHGYAQAYTKCFVSPSPRIIVAEKEMFFVQDLLKQAAFLITDYSSVACDYAYMKKPMLYFQFDAEEFSQKQYAESAYYTYEKNGYGPIAVTFEDVMAEIRKSYENGFQMEEKYIERVNDFFGQFGKEHCEKTYKLIEEL